MQMTDKVRVALAVLRDAAENDFERHRLDVLERDLTTPPVVECCSPHCAVTWSWQKRKGDDNGSTSNSNK